MTLKPPTKTFPKLVMKEWPERRGFFATLSPEQQKAALEYRGDENHGDERFSLKPLSDFTRVLEGVEGQKETPLRKQEPDHD